MHHKTSNSISLTSKKLKQKILTESTRNRSFSSHNSKFVPSAPRMKPRKGEKEPQSVFTLSNFEIPEENDLNLLNNIELRLNISIDDYETKKLSDMRKEFYKIKNETLKTKRAKDDSNLNVERVISLRQLGDFDIKYDSLFDFYMRKTTSTFFSSLNRSSCIIDFLEKSNSSFEI